MPGIRRRQVLFAASGLAAGCSRGSVERPRSLVAISRAPGYGQDLYEIVHRLLSEVKADLRGKRIVLKPNLVEFDPGTCINTHPVFVHAVLESCRRLGASGVLIAEGPGHRRVTLDLAEAAGYFSVIPKFEDLFVDLNVDATTLVPMSHSHSKLSELYLPVTALGADLLVSIPKLKTHHWVGATLSMKNLFGLVPSGVYGWPKNILHWAGIHDSVADLYGLFPRQFAIVDGITGMEGNGPIQGTPRQAGLVIAGPDLASVDNICCRVMGIDPEKIEYLQMADSRYAFHTHAPEVIGEQPQSVRTDFQLLDAFRELRLSRS